MLVVDADPQVQLQRLLARDGGDREQAQAILAAQASREQRLAAADDVIGNDGDREHLAERVAALHRRYLELFEAAAAD